MGPVAQKLLDFPEIPVGQSPVVRVEHAEIEDRVALDAARVVHVALGVTECESAWRREDRLASVQSGIA